MTMPNDYADTDASYAALTNVANVLQAQHDTIGAITAFKRILERDSPEFHEQDMVYANYRHHACYQLSELYEQEGNLKLAEKYAQQAAEKDTICDWCGVYAVSVQMELEQRVKSLRARIAQ